MSLGVAIIGAGLQGRRRAQALAQAGSGRLVAVTSAAADDARALALGHGAQVYTRTADLLGDNRVDVVIVCTPPSSHAELAIRALAAGKHVLCEKPMARTVAECVAMVTAARQAGRVLWCGWNHRHHPAIREVKRVLDAGEIGRPLFGRAVYGIGARPDMAAEWRADPAIAAGGHLTEQGIHLVDLFRWMLGDLREVAAMTQESAVPMRGMEDSGFALLRGAGGVVVSVHSALTQWVNRFDLELFGEHGYVRVQGLGGSYGVEELTVGLRDDTGPFSARRTEFRGGDSSWRDEWAAFAGRIAELDGAPPPDDPALDGRDGLVALAITHTAYRAGATGRTLPIPTAADLVAREAPAGAGPARVITRTD